MKYQKIDMGSYNLHIINTNTFKSTVVNINFRRKVVKEEILIRNLLKEVMLKSTSIYKTEKSLLRKLDELYDVKLSSRNYRMGKYTNLSFSLKLLNEEYTEKGMLNQSIKFLLEILFKPNIKDNSFDNETVERCKEKINKDILTLKDDKTKFSIIRLMENMNLNEASYNPYGYEEDLELITASNLYEYYNSVINNDLIDVFVVGNVEAHKIKQLFRKTFNVITYKKEHYDIIVDSRLPRKRINKIREVNSVNQTKIAIGCIISSMNDYERKYVLTVLNEILGGDFGLLYSIVREKYSLCYYAYSIPRMLDNVIIIYSGMDSKMIDKAIKLIKKLMLAIAKNNFDDKLIDKAKQGILASLQSLEGSQNGIIDNYYSQELMDCDNFDVKKEKITKVTRDDIVNLAKKVHFDTVYLLEGENNEED